VKFTASPLGGVCVIDMERIEDERGFFARSFCTGEFKKHGLTTSMSQCSVSFNALRGTLRGLHLQSAPHEEDKLVRCTAGSVFDVVVDVRPGSPTYRQWYGTELSAANHRALYIPGGCAHGFITLTDATELFYMISTSHVPGFARGFRWDDPAFAVVWPMTPAVISSRDAGYPLFDAATGA